MRAWIGTGRRRLALATGVLALTLAACGGTAPSNLAAGADPAAAGGGDDGSLPEDRKVTPFDTEYAAITKLDPSLLDAVRQAARDARADDIELLVTSGWRSREYQQRLLDEAIVKYGNLEKAREYVNTPDKSTHVTGDAVDIGPTDAADWVIRHGSDYGLCQTYANEMWHFELMTSPGGDCPRPLPDAAG